MKIFKKKIKRSEWMSGLLFAEAKIKEGWKDYDIKRHCGRQQFLCNDEGGVVEVTSIENYPFCNGVLDYLNHYKNNLKQHLTSLPEV